MWERHSHFHFIPTELSFLGKINHGLKAIAHVLTEMPSEQGLTWDRRLGGSKSRRCAVLRIVALGEDTPDAPRAFADPRAFRQEAPIASAGNAGSIDLIPDWFTGGDMLAAGGFCYRMLGWPTGELLVSRKDSPASARAPDRLLTIKNRFDHPCGVPPVRKPQSQSRGMRVAPRPTGGGHGPRGAAAGDVTKTVRAAVRPRAMSPLRGRRKTPQQARGLSPWQPAPA